MSVVKQLLDKIFFTFGVIVFLQLPHFIDQYTQRLGGYAESKRQQLQDYQTIANKNFKGDLSLLIESFLKASDSAVQQTGENISETKMDVFLLEDDVEKLNSNSLFSKVVYLSTNLRYDLAKGTLQSFQPGIPFNLWALLYGLIGGILFSLLFNGTTKLPRLVMRKKQKSLSSKPHYKNVT